MKDHKVEQLMDSLRRLPAYTPPRELTERLRVIASRENLRHRRHESMETWWTYALGELVLRCDNLMRPVAVPAFGGLVSALVLFAAMSPTFAVQQRVVGDVPTGLTTAASPASSISFSLSDQDIVVDVMIDENGRVVDYSIPQWQKGVSDPALISGIQKTLVFTQFTPATLFGMPASMKTRITLRRSMVEVRG